MSVKWLGHGSFWGCACDFWKCEECNCEFFSVPRVQKCLRKERKCVECEYKKGFWQRLKSKIKKLFKGWNK